MSTQPKIVVVCRQGRLGVSGAHRRQLRLVASASYFRQHGPLSRTAAAERFAEAEIVGATNAVLPSIDEPFLRSAPNLRVLVLQATGYDHVDLDLLARRGVALSVLPRYATQSVAEHALAMLFALATRSHLANDRARGRVDDNVSLRGVELAGRTLCIVGLGRIGMRLAAIASGIGMRVIGCEIDPDASKSAEAEGVEQLDLAEALKEADAVAICASRKFRGEAIIGRDHLAIIRSGAFLVNVARPELVDSNAAADALRGGSLRGYAVDDVAYSPSSKVADLIDQGRILQTAHSAWWSDEALDRGRTMWGAAILAAARGRPQDVVELVKREISHRIDFSEGDSPR